MPDVPGSQTNTEPIGAEPAAFDQALASVRDVDGWMTDAQAQRLWDRACDVGSSGSIVEIGSYRGRSTILLATAAAPEVAVIAIDPHGGNDRGPRQITGSVDEGEDDHERFHANLLAGGVDTRIRHVRLPSQDAGAEITDPVGLLYIDGAHRYGPARNDIRDWGRRVAADGTMLIHDSFSSVGVTLAIMTQLLTGKRFRYVGRSGSLTEFRRDHLVGRARLANAGRLLLELPWFARNLVIKTLIVAHLRPLTRLLGHPSGEWPY